MNGKAKSISIFDDNIYDMQWRKYLILHNNNNNVFNISCATFTEIMINDTDFSVHGIELNIKLDGNR